MNKCDFCTKSSPNKKCFWSSQAARENDCAKAIEKMMKVLHLSNDKKKKSLFK